MIRQYRVVALPGEGIGPEVVKASLKVLQQVAKFEGFSVAIDYGLIGEPALNKLGSFFPTQTAQLCESADGILFGAVTRGGILELRKHFDFFINLRPVRIFESLLDKSSLQPDRVSGLDLLFVRELISGIYFGPSGRADDENGCYGYHTMRYHDWELRRIARVALQKAKDRRGLLTVAHKENALPHLPWSRLVQEEAEHFPGVIVEPMLVDNLAMQLVRDPKHFDVVLAGNLFGDILSDIGGALVGSIGLLASASLNTKGFGLYEAVHGTALNIAGKGIANPLGTLGAVVLMLQQWGENAAAQNLIQATERVLAQGYRTADLAPQGQEILVNTAALVDLIVQESEPTVLSQSVRLMGKKPKVLILGDDINTDDIIPANHCTSADSEHLKRYAFEHLIGEGNLLGYEVIEAGRNFGCGSSRENAPIAIKAAGIKKVRARSFAEIFYRNSINIGLTLEITEQPQTNSVVEAIVEAGGLTSFNQKRRNGQTSVPGNSTPSRPLTMTEKLLARASGNDYVQPGETVFVGVDLAMCHDAVAGSVVEVFYKHFGKAESLSTGNLCSELSQREARVWEPNRVVFVADHFIQTNDVRVDPKANLLHKEMVQFAQAQGCHLFDVVSPGEAAGICHVLLPEKGFIHPGMIVAGTDSHTCTYGAFGCFSTGVGTTDMANLFSTGDMWIRVPQTLLFVLEGTLAKYISAKDIMLFILGQIGCDGATGKVIQFCGSIIDQLPIEERMTLANMAIECGAMCGLMAPDEITREYVRSRSDTSFEELISDPDAEYEKIYQFDLSNLEPQVACPPKPDQVVEISELGDVPITRAFIGSCTGGKLFDLAQAAEVLKGRHVAPGVDLFVVPASQEVRQKAEHLGYFKIFEEAGVQILKSGCGACINAGIGGLGKEETGVYATNRNFKGRSGDPTAKNYLASPRVVAVSAVMGKITHRSNDEGNLSG